MDTYVSIVKQICIVSKFGILLKQIMHWMFVRYAFVMVHCFSRSHSFVSTIDASVVYCQPNVYC